MKGGLSSGEMVREPESDDEPQLIGRPDARFFLFVGPSFWRWVPAQWVRSGTVVIDSEDRFWRLHSGTHDGWWTEPVQPDEVGNAAHIARIKAARLAFDSAPAQSTPLPLLDNMREELVRLCNPRIKDRPETGLFVEPWWAKRTAVVVTGGMFVAALVNAIRMFALFGPEARREGVSMLSTYLVLLTLIGFLLAFIPFLYFRYPHKMRRFGFKFGRSANLIGCIGISFLLLVAAAIVWLVVMFGNAGPMGN